MAYELQNLTADDTNKIERYIEHDPLKGRILERLSETTVEWSIDRKADSFLLPLNATSRADSSQEHFAFYAMGYFIEVRSTLRGYNTMSFYNFPNDLEQYRAYIETLFLEADFTLTGLRLGMVKGKVAHAPAFFTCDNWFSRDI